MTDDRDPKRHDHELRHDREAGHREHVPGHEELELAFDHEHEGLSSGRDPAPHEDAPQAKSEAGRPKRPLSLPDERIEPAE